ncbi:sensor histidine kinase [Agrobacterium fabrum]|jgi:signal transduction histidine kinase|uniref:histidine kinase n=1 Tax=Agrobacterium fabrum TaxID=1176649 RepID=A0A7Z7FMH8_9HYPH|nr:HAMP domain-containing sensor histidine kinase [Agrobacterium fabrum]MCR6724041.1 HAMP domain-containing histidine kinase [Agrobacterium fabrum]UXT58163.1 HAMP domain-containing histidine kinase [Agrobacterium fabrum]WCK75822.1 HAMP domain-containing sensor histidine kinase [Agrobacterium fabrum]WIE26916.1 HAMP domain-containing sensor histidine kinase [Agrobacterium fabrum]WIE42873.1 HAMP domain-containing sensor histidine kinase [Agrobacterium fabrum]
MKKTHDRSLRWGLMKRLFALQAFLLLLFVILLIGWIWIIDPRLEGANEEAARIVAESVTKDAQGRPQLSATPELAELKRRYPNLWFVVRDTDDIVLQYGVVPASALSVAFPWSFDRARLEAAGTVRATVENRDTSAGRLQFIAGTEEGILNEGLSIWINVQLDLEKDAKGAIRWLTVLPALSLIILIAVVPMLILTGIATLLVTPRAVGRSLSGLMETVKQAQSIDFDNRSARIDRSKVPLEIIPLVDAFNVALSKLDDGYNRRNRFLADAAHELRTPIAIVRTRADLLPDDALSRQIRADIDRLTRVAHQLLEMQAVGAVELPAEPCDLNKLVEHIATDLAPIAMDAGYEFDFEPSVGAAIFTVQASIIEMAVVNLVRNAIDHAGGRGAITIRIDAAGAIEVCDEGPGIPVPERGQVFEPFHRINTNSPGAGLGLNLVQKAAELHRGRVLFLDLNPGFCVRLEIRSVVSKAVAPGNT